MKYQINSIILKKMGWEEPTYTLFQNNIINQISLQIKDESILSYFVAKKGVSCFKCEENIYVIIFKDDIYEFLLISENKIKLRKNIDNNLTLFKLIRENLSCNEKYKRLFKINSIINEKRS